MVFLTAEVNQDEAFRSQDQQVVNHRQKRLQVWRYKAVISTIPLFY